jgi:hypothetical protein
MTVKLVRKTTSGEGVYLTDEMTEDRDLTALVIGEMNKGGFEKKRVIMSCEMRNGGYDNSRHRYTYEGKRIEDVTNNGDFVYFKEASVVEREDEFAGPPGERELVSKSIVSYRYDTLNNKLEKC